MLALAVLPDGRLVSSSGTGTLQVWDVGNTESRSLQGHADSVTVLAVLPDGRIPSCAYDWAMALWDPDTGQRIKEFHGEAKMTACAVLGPDRVVVGSANGAVHFLKICN